jgi:ribosomal protein L22
MLNLLNLLQNAKANAEAKKLNLEKLVINKCICSSSQ